MNSRTDPRKHFVPATFNWMCENFSRVYIHIAVKHPDVIVPPGITAKKALCGIKTKNGNSVDTINAINTDVVTLNFGVDAVNSFYQNDTGFGCKMRFGGIARDIFVPFESVVMITSPDCDDNSGTSVFALYYGQENLSNTNSDASSDGNEVNDQKKERLSQTMKLLTKAENNNTLSESEQYSASTTKLINQRPILTLRQRPTLTLVKNNDSKQ